MMAEVGYHTPVMLDESVEALALHENGVYVDVTFGGGGHSREILRRLPSGARLFSFDQDSDSMSNLDEEFSAAAAEGKFEFVLSNFRHLSRWMRYYDVEAIDGLLADLGVSSHHFDDVERGFSFRGDAPLDMRMNKNANFTAAEVVNGYDEERLADVFYRYGELRQSRQIAAAIVKARKMRPIATTNDFLSVADKFFPHERMKKEKAKLFQALRIEVNGEMDALSEMLTDATRLLTVGGRLSVITYHSLEDRMVKNFMKSGNASGRVETDFFGRSDVPLRPVGKLTTPSDDEQERNSRSRSAKLRVAEKLKM